MQQLSQKLRAFMEAHSLTQSEFATAANVNQSTLSRILRRNPQRSGRALKALCNYAGIETENAQTSTTEPKRLIMDTFMKIWDGTDLHAETVARIIDALQNVRLQSTRTGGRLP
jgi:transcriptional regulator with XRE-family HTH domain